VIGSKENEKVQNKEDSGMPAWGEEVQFLKGD
jgi:hypothetical protein